MCIVPRELQKPEPDKAPPDAVERGLRLLSGPDGSFRAAKSSTAIPTVDAEPQARRHPRIATTPN
jgi:hypothetical protein